MHASTLPSNVVTRIYRESSSNRRHLNFYNADRGIVHPKKRMPKKQHNKRQRGPKIPSFGQIGLTKYHYGKRYPGRVFSHSPVGRQPRVERKKNRKEVPAHAHNIYLGTRRRHFSMRTQGRTCLIGGNHDLKLAICLVSRLQLEGIPTRNCRCRHLVIVNR